VPKKKRRRKEEKRGVSGYEGWEKEEVSTNELYVSDGKQARREKYNLTSST
jgi:hypothetical protein